MITVAIDNLWLLRSKPPGCEVDNLNLALVKPRFLAITHSLTECVLNIIHSIKYTNNKYLVVRGLSLTIKVDAVIVRGVSSNCVYRFPRSGHSFYLTIRFPENMLTL